MPFGHPHGAEGQDQLVLAQHRTPSSLDASNMLYDTFAIPNASCTQVIPARRGLRIGPSLLNKSA